MCVRSTGAGAGPIGWGESGKGSVAVESRFRRRARWHCAVRDRACELVASPVQRIQRCEDGLSIIIETTLEICEFQRRTSQPARASPSKSGGGITEHATVRPSKLTAVTERPQFSGSRNAALIHTKINNLCFFVLQFLIMMFHDHLFEYITQL